MSGAGFLRDTMSPANTVTLWASSAPSARVSVAITEGSADVDATATGQPAVMASPAILAIPDRGGTLSSVTSCV